jgi:hypothetical protein
MLVANADVRASANSDLILEINSQLLSLVWVTVRPIWRRRWRDKQGCLSDDILVGVGHFVSKSDERGPSRIACIVETANVARLVPVDRVADCFRE